MTLEGAGGLFVIRTFPNEMEASIAEAALEAHGIQSSLMMDSAGGTMPWLNTLHPIRLVVRESDIELARSVLDGLDND
jgi:putative signal transducing protein